MAKRDSRSGEPPQSSQSAFDFKIHVLGPVAGGTPWWARRAKLRYTHMVIQVDNYIWDQPIRGIGKLYHASEWLTHALRYPREWGNFDIEIQNEDIGIDALMQVSKEISGRKAQPIRTALRFLHLWPWRPWNCTGPALALLAAAGCPLKGETPDAIIGELISTLERAGHLATGEQDTLDNLAGVE